MQITAGRPMKKEIGLYKIAKAMVGFTQIG